MLTPAALAHPYRFLVGFAAKYELPFAQTLEQGDNAMAVDSHAQMLIEHHETTRAARRASFSQLSPFALDRLRTLVLDLGSCVDGKPPEAWTPVQRVRWCLQRSSLSRVELDELCAVAPAVAYGLALPEQALDGYRAGRPLDDVHYRAPTLSVVGPLPSREQDQQVMRLRLLNELVFAPPYNTADWMARWLFYRPGRQHRRFTATINWLRRGLDKLAALADYEVRIAARRYRARFFHKPDLLDCPVVDSKFSLWMYGYGEVADPAMEAMVAEQARSVPRKAIDHVRIALVGDAEAVYEALREAGTAALRWPWILQVVDGWRAAVEGANVRDREEAKQRLLGVGAALVRITGRGPVSRSDRSANMREAVELLRSYFESYRRDDGTPVPPRLLEIGDAVHADWNARGSARNRRHQYTRLDQAAIVAARARVTRPQHDLQVARDVVSAAFAVARSTVVREA